MTISWDNQHRWQTNGSWGTPFSDKLMSMTCCYMLKIDGFVKIDGFFHCKPLVKLHVFEFGNSNGMSQCWGSSVQLLYCFESSGQSLQLPWCISYIFVSFKILHQKGVLQHHCDYSGQKFFFCGWAALDPKKKSWQPGNHPGWLWWTPSTPTWTYL